MSEHDSATGLPHIEAFEIRAEAFRRSTGFMRPGKSVSIAANGPHTDMERSDAWDAWWRQHGAVVNATIRAYQSIMGTPEASAGGAEG